MDHLQFLFYLVLLLPPHIFFINVPFCIVFQGFYFRHTIVEYFILKISITSVVMFPSLYIFLLLGKKIKYFVSCYSSCLFINNFPRFRFCFYLTMLHFPVPHFESFCSSFLSLSFNLLTWLYSVAQASWVKNLAHF